MPSFWSTTRGTVVLIVVLAVLLSVILQASFLWWRAPQTYAALPAVFNAGPRPPPPAAHAPPSAPPAAHADLSLDEIHEMVGRTAGFLARDYSLWLGWNNMRYILEMALLHATLLNRTLVVPSFVYARACEFDQKTCAAFATMVNRNDATKTEEWRGLPLDQQMAWVVPLNIMIDVPALRAKYNFVTVAEYLALQGLPPTLEASNGAWLKREYHSGAHAPALAAVANSRFDPGSILRVDRVPAGPKEDPDSPLGKALRSKMFGHIVSWDAAKAALPALQTDAEREGELAQHGWVTLYTYAPTGTSDGMKSPVYPVREVAPASALRGLVDEFGAEPAEVLLLEGEFHWSRKAGGLRFTSAGARDAFTDCVLRDMHVLPAVHAVAARLAARMADRVGGRMWAGAHMRRGDFARLRWTTAATMTRQFDRLADKIKAGRALLRQIHASGVVQGFDIPNGTTDGTLLTREPPLDSDPFFLATDERSAAGTAYFTSHGAVQLADLITPADRDVLGWPLLLTDVQGLVEQALLARADYFVGPAMSSFPGGVLNMRAVRGADPRTHVFE